jgi:hypothetical protein
MLATHTVASRSRQLVLYLLAFFLTRLRLCTQHFPSLSRQAAWQIVCTIRRHSKELHAMRQLNNPPMCLLVCADAVFPEYVQTRCGLFGLEGSCELHWHSTVLVTLKHRQLIYMLQMMRAQPRAVTSGQINTARLAAPTVPPICPPFHSSNGTFLPTNGSFCAAMIPPTTPVSALTTVYTPLVCGAADGVLDGANETRSRQNCMAVGKPLLATDFAIIGGNAQAIGVRPCHQVWAHSLRAPPCIAQPFTPVAHGGQLQYLSPCWECFSSAASTRKLS